MDPNRTLEEVVAEYDARNAKRMSELEGGGLLTGRCLAEFADTFTRRQAETRGAGGPHEERCGKQGHVWDD